jgi:putative chitinase
MSFNFNFTQAKLVLCLPKNKELNQWFPALFEQLDKYEINTLERVAAFLSQCAHESLDFTVVTENLNYGAAGLQTTFKKYFPTAELAKQYERNPERIANLVYANRMNNGNAGSGDGWKFRGRGIIQLTGKENYTACSQYIFKDDRLTKDVSWLETKQGCVGSACWFWNSRKINQFADKGDVVGVTKLINGGGNGLEDRKDKYSAFKAFLSS